MESEANQRNNESRLPSIVAGPFSFVVGLVAGSTIGSPTAAVTGEDRLRKDIFDGPTDRYIRNMEWCYLAGRTVGQLAILGGIVYYAAN